MLAVLVLLGMVAGTLLVGFSGTFGRARQELARSGVGVICGKLEMYRMDRNSWPANEVGLAALTDGQALPTEPHYLTPAQLRDPWGHAYLYLTPGPDGHPFEVLSYGADALPGGEGEDADISSVNSEGAKP